MVIGQKTYNFLGLFNITLNNSWVIILLVCIILLSMSSAIVLSLFIAGGLLVLLCDDSLATVIGVESLTLLQLVVLFHNQSYFSSESSLKYLLVSILGGALIVLGILFSYSLLGGFDLGITYSVALFLLLVGIFFKLAMGGFHFWLMDVIEGAGAKATAIFMTLGKIPPFYLLGAVQSSLSGVTNSAILLGAVTSLIISGLGTIQSTKLSRFTAYSAIGSTGWYLIQVSIQQSYLSLLYVIFTVIIMLCFIFLVLVNSSYIINLRGQKVIGALIIILLVMCFSGFPPFLGFQVKWQLLYVLFSSSWLFPLVGQGILLQTYGYFRWLFQASTYFSVQKVNLKIFLRVISLISLFIIGIVFVSIILLIQQTGVSFCVFQGNNNLDILKLIRDVGNKYFSISIRVYNGNMNTSRFTAEFRSLTYDEIKKIPGYAKIPFSNILYESVWRFIRKNSHIRIVFNSCSKRVSILINNKWLDKSDCFGEKFSSISIEPYRAKKTKSQLSVIKTNVSLNEKPLSVKESKKYSLNNTKVVDSVTNIVEKESGEGLYFTSEGFHLPKLAESVTNPEDQKKGFKDLKIISNTSNKKNTK